MGGGGDGLPAVAGPGAGDQATNQISAKAIEAGWGRTEPGQDLAATAAEG
jgi:hypothetical protein